MRQDLPTGVVTLLFTDIEGSTRLLSELRSGYVDALAEHRRLIREAVAAHGGVEVDTQGDSFLVAFPRPSGAVAAAIAAQRALADGPVKVRMGIHTGEPELTDEGYVGLDVHRGARIGDAGHGGQILLSSTTHALVDIDTTDLGEHRLGGIDRTEHLYGVRVDGLRTEFPPLRAIDTSEPDLPSWLTAFIGRESELAQLDQRLDDAETRIVTLVGPGGAGKTRLAAEAARRRWAASGELTAFASAIGVEDGDELVHAICDGVGFTGDTAHGFGRTLREQVGDFLVTQPRLVIVDNVEHVDDAGEVLAEIAQSAPTTRLLVTSRRRLNLAGEWVIEVGGLRPAVDASTAADPTNPAIRLFLERARRAAADLTVNDEDWPHIRRICDLLDDMPLGIELAAAWMGTLSASELADEIATSFDLLATSAADLAPRHRSLRAAFEGSWRLLDDRQRKVFAGLSVFVGSFDREMARAVTSVDATDLGQLVARSLVRRRADGRFEVHELLRQYAAAELAEAGREAVLREAHAQAFTGRLLASEEALTSAASVETRADLAPDTSNLRVALEWAVSRWSTSQIEPLLMPAAGLWTMSVDPITVEIWTAVDRAARERKSRPTDEAGAVAIHHLVAPQLAFALAIVDDNEAADAVVNESLPVLESAGRSDDAAMCRMVLGIDLCNRNENEAAIEPLEASDAVLRQPQHRLMRGELLTWLGWARLMTDDAEGAREAFDVAYDICNGLGEPVATAFALSKLALLEDFAGNYEAALERHLAAFARFEAAGNDGGVGYALSRASFTAYCLGRYQAALDFAQAAYEGFAELNHHWGLILVTARLGYAYLGLNQPDEAERWALHSLELARASDRLGGLHALGAVAGAQARRGDPEGLRTMRAVVADEAMPQFLATQILAEIDVAVARFGDLETGDTPDLDATIKRLLERPHPTPVLR